MEMRSLRDPSLRVSRIALGTGPIGNMFVNKATDAGAADAIQAAWEGGVRFFDTAPFYGAGLAERRLGAGLAGIPRNQFILSTKVGRLVLPGGSVVEAYRRDGVLRSIEESLARLRTDYVDIVLIHDPDHHYRAALNEMYPVLADLRSQGVIKAVGAGMNQWEMLKAFALHADFDCFLLAGRYTLLEQGAAPFLELCQARGIDLFLGGLFNSGILAVGARPGAWYNYSPAPEAVIDRVRRLEAVCARHGVSLRSAALQFPLAHPAVTSLVLGAVSRAEVEENLAAVQTPLPPALWDDLRHARAIS
ncbi:MAG: aldo/keto reductase [Bacillota bacterium]